METHTSYYAWGNPPINPGPLARFLPPLPEGLAASLLSSQKPPLASGSWILDPFGASPHLAVELARAGYRVLVAANNPVARFLLEMAANPPPESEFRAALAELASARKGEERIEHHLRALYSTDCAHCGRSIMADAFIWEKDSPSPYARIYTCPYCGDSGEHPATGIDTERAAIAIAGLHRIRALERVAPLNDPDRSNVEEALAVYPSRAVYAIFTLINKIDGLSLPPLRRRCIEALLLSTCDQANTLWAYPTSRERPRQLGVPPRYRENNVWLALEESISLWAKPDPKVHLETWHADIDPESIAGGSICIFEGRMRELSIELSNLSFSAIISALPRPNQAFWTLSALWAGWLWGRDAVGPFKSVLRRRRYDWAWHTTALTSTMTTMAECLPSGIPFFGLVGEVEPGFIKAAMIAADMAGFDICEMIFRDSNLPAYLVWQNGHASESLPPLAQLPTLIQTAEYEYLQTRGEPADYLHLSAAALLHTAKLHVFRPPEKVALSLDKPDENPADLFNRTQSVIRETLTYHGGFLRYGSGDALDAGYWWLKEHPQPILPQADRVEMEVVRYLVRHPNSTYEQIDSQLCQIFSGIYTPAPDLIRACLNSYGEQDAGNNDRWIIRAPDTPENRRAEINTIYEQLDELAKRLGYRVQGTEPMVWLDNKNQPQYWFYVKASAIFSEIFISSGLPPDRTIIVLPGSRANLVVFKLRRDPRLNHFMQSGWRFLKYRHLRWLLGAPILSKDRFDELLVSDPLTDSAIQQRLF